jgi:Zn-dependent M28 family amino/carboxypeptidase
MENSELTLKERLHHHLYQIAQERDPYWSPLGHAVVKSYLHQQLSQWGVVETHAFTLRDQIHENLIVNLPARQGGSSAPILIGAHYDAVPASPGADDNASGVAVLLELARLFAADPPHSAIRLVAFDLEEYGLLGSRAYAESLKQQGQKLRLMLSLEMLGYRDPNPGSQTYPAGLERFYPNRGDFIGLIGNWPTIPILMRLSRQMRRSGVPCEWLPAGERGLMVPQVRASDHAPFWDLGYRAILVTDTSYLRNPHYHRLSDRIETLDLDFLTSICRGLAEGIQHL